MNTKTLTVKVTTTGGPGMAFGDAHVALPGPITKLLALSVHYDAACPATTYVCVYCDAPMIKILLHLDTQNTDFPLSQVTELEIDRSGVPRGPTATCHQFCAGLLWVNINNCDAITDAVTVTAVVEV
jgi:hypothetical protein